MTPDLLRGLGPSRWDWSDKLCVCAALRVEELGLAGSAQSDAERHHRLGAAGRIAALCPPGVGGTLPGERACASQIHKNTSELVR